MAISLPPSGEVGEACGEGLDLLVMRLVDADGAGKAPEERVMPQDLRVSVALRAGSRPHHTRPEGVTEELVAEADPQGWAAVVLHGVYLLRKLRLDPLPR